MPNLRRLTIIATSDRLYHRDALEILTPTNLPSLQYLRLHLAYDMRPKAIEALYPLFSRLEELSVRGNWYRELDPQHEWFLTHAPWRLRLLCIDHQLLAMQHLKTIVISGIGLGRATEYKTLEPMRMDAVWTKEILKRVIEDDELEENVVEVLQAQGATIDDI
ncbi:hypothetical protein EC991_010688, partial [Linnemannia zychae]